MAGARIDRNLWIDFCSFAKKSGKTVAEALEDTLRAAIPSQKGKRG